MFKGNEFIGSFSLYPQEVRPFTEPSKRRTISNLQVDE